MAKKIKEVVDEEVKQGTERFDKEGNEDLIKDLQSKFAWSDMGDYINIHYNQPL